MATIAITDEEKETLSHALEIYLTDLKEEVFKTDNREAKESLRREEEVIQGLLKKIEAMKAGV